jgi:hypothetical protein
MNDRQQLQALARQTVARDRAFVEVFRTFMARDAWLRARLVELHQRVKALDGVTPVVPPWPELVIPPALVGLLDEED